MNILELQNLECFKIAGLLVAARIQQNENEPFTNGEISGMLKEAYIMVCETFIQILNPQGEGKE
jgi:hypothetical protein